MRSFLIRLALFAGCDVRGSIGVGFDPTTWKVAWSELSFAPTADADVLFVLADSPPRAPRPRSRQAALAEALPGFAASLPAGHFHFAVVTANLGAGNAAVGDCAPPGDAALLVTLGRAAPDGCAGPADGARYLDIDNGGNNLPPGLTLAETLGCMTAVGDTGCGFNQPLEAARRALGEPLNQGFLRDGTRLYVVFLVDGDDCSAPPGSPLFDPARTDLGPFDASRCAHTELLWDLLRYRSFFFSGGARIDPNQVRLEVVAALDATRLPGLIEGSPQSGFASVENDGAVDYALGTIATSLGDGVPPCLAAPIANPTEPECHVASAGNPLPSCNGDDGVPPCWEVRSWTSCIPVFNPRAHESEQLALALRGTPLQPITGGCQVLVPQ